MKRLLGFLIVTAVIVVLIMWQTGGFEAKIKAETPPLPTNPPISGNAEKAKKITVPIVEEAVGTIQSRHKVDVTPRIQAVIEEIRVNAGDRVKQGDLLVRLDKRDLEANVGLAEQALKAAEANYR
jgi:multidrug efflux pump subunit AcrA (membrane-fusion protein)